MVGRKSWQVLSLILVAALSIAALPLIVGAQTEAVVSTSVEGELIEQFSKHYLEINPIDESQDMDIVLEFDPNDNQELGNNSGFVVFTQSQFEAATRMGGNLTRPSLAKIAVGSATVDPDTGLNVKTATVGTDAEVLVVFNDSPQTLFYRLEGTNVEFRDDSGDQVTDATAAATVDADAEAEAEAEAEATAEEPTAEATVAETAEATADEDTETDVEDEATGEQEEVAETATVETDAEATTASPTAPRTIRVSAIEGELNELYAQHYFEVEVQNVSNPVNFAFTYDPQDSTELDRGLNVYILSQDQFRSWASGGGNLGRLNTLALELNPRAEAKTKIGTISDPFGTYVAIVENSTETDATYELTVDNAVLIDDSQQSLTAQELSTTAEAIVDASDEETDAGATTDADTTTDTTTDTTAATGEGAIEVGTTYTVQSGDTLGVIARRAYGDLNLYQALCDYNNIENCNVIEVGDQIEIPAQSELDTAAGTTTTTETSETAATATPTTAATATQAAETEQEPTATPTPTTEEMDDGEVDGEEADSADTAETEEAPESDGEDAEATPTTAPTATPEAEASDGAANGQTIVQSAATFNVLDTLGLLLDLLELEQDQANNIKAILNSDGPYTLFAPTDSAFTELPEETLTALIADPAELASVLRFHIVPGALNVDDLSDGMAIETLNGATVEVAVAGDGTVSVGGATVTQADVAASNGVVHVIDSVLLPPAQ